MEAQLHLGDQEEEVMEVVGRRRSANGRAATGHVNAIDDADQNKGEAVKSVYLDQSRDFGAESLTEIENFGAEVIGNRDVQKVLSAVMTGQLLPPPSTSSAGATEHVTIEIIDEGDEEITELEFLRTVNKQHTHDMYCPNCRSPITKVILRRRKNVDPPSIENPCWGCLSCCSFFIPGSKENCFGVSWGSWGKGTDKEGNGLQRPGKDGIHAGAQLPVDKRPAPGDSPGVEGDVVPDEPVPSPGIQEYSKSVEILKSVIYGGLTESITSLSIVSSAAASGATSLNIVSLAVANLIGGILVFGPNLRNLKNEPKVESNETNPRVDGYEQLLGRRENFPLHATFALVSFLIFGLIPPAVYGFTFRESDDKDFKLLAVAVASLLAIILLAIGKAYISGEHRFSNYIKTVAYYVVTAAAASGLSYVVGDQIKQLMEKLGWFDPNAPATSFSSPHHINSLNQALASY